ncbi:MAG: enoyl-CoA hydratase [Rhodanobacter sp. SCN 68-63]|nr:MAG: enoyl-CoA hydratase [Rhodanobacter sp. SCN 68-63]
MTSRLSIADQHRVRRIALNRPEVHNAFDDVLIAELTAAIDEAGRDENVRAVVLTGEGESFSAGADLNWMRSMAQASEQQNRDDSTRLARLMRRLQFCPKPTIARVNGAAFGGGVGLIACCDIAIGVEGAKFGLTEVKLGLVPAVISPYVIAAIGLRQVRKLFLTGEFFDAAAAARIGLLHEAVPREQLDEAVQRVLGFLGKAGPVAQAEAKTLALGMAGLDEAAAERIDEENAALIARLRVSAEGQEGLGAFLGKRAAAWVV